MIKVEASVGSDTRKAPKLMNVKVGENLWNPVNWDFREFITGWGSAFINICITYPINKVIFRQVLHDVSPLRAITQLRKEGIFILYRGILPPLCQKTSSLSLMFGVYEGSLRPLSQSMPLLAAKVSAGMLAGTTEAILMPFERIQTLLQDQKYQKLFKNTPHAFQRIGAEFGFAEAYRGMVPILLRNGPSNVLYFIARDEARAFIDTSSTTAVGTVGKNFLCGGLIGGVISTIFYPLNVIKVHMQSKLGGDFQGIVSAAQQIYNERGRTVGCFYRGVHLNYTRGFISWGIIGVSTEVIKKFIY